MRKIQIAIADDHHLMRVGIQTMLNKQMDMESVFQCDNGYNLLDYIRTQSGIDIALVDYEMIGGGVELVRNLKAIRPRMKVVVLTVHDGPVYYQHCENAGADGFLVKADNMDFIAESLRKIYEGDKVVSENVRTSFEPSPNLLIQLTRRETEIVKDIAAGQRPQQIATNRSLSISTVRNHIQSIYNKLNVKSRHQLLALLKADSRS